MKRRIATIIKFSEWKENEMFSKHEKILLTFHIKSRISFMV